MFWRGCVIMVLVYVSVCIDVGVCVCVFICVYLFKCVGGCFFFFVVEDIVGILWFIEVGWRWLNV